MALALRADHFRNGSGSTKLNVSTRSPLHTPVADIGAEIVFRRFGPLSDLRLQQMTSREQRRRATEKASIAQRFNEDTEWIEAKFGALKIPEMASINFFFSGAKPPAPTDQQIAEIVVRESRQGYYSTARPCACPDDLARNGTRCGMRSAYSHPGGASPKCYLLDVTTADIAAFRARQLPQ
jgi:hypothetical protein